jgi:hypothetical protein
MKNILGTTKDLVFYNKEGVLVYKFIVRPNESRAEYFYEKNGRLLKRIVSDGYWEEYTRNSYGSELTFKDSNGAERGFEIPEFTMEELVQKLGNFKIKNK